MKCCICGQPISNYGNNPFPLCAKQDWESRCCNDCDNLVIKARLKQYEHYDKAKHSPEVGDDLLIFYAKSSNRPIEMILEGKYLTNTVTEIKENKAYGEWGDFPIDVTEDSYIIL